MEVGQRLKVIFTNIVSSSLAWITRDPVPTVPPAKKKEEKKNPKITKDKKQTSDVRP